METVPGKYSYNSWPLGQLPDSWKRPEPELIRNKGYSWQDPRDIVDIFEVKLAKYAGSKFAAVLDCDSHALFLSLKFLDFKGEVSIPSRTYASVPMQILHAGASFSFRDEAWHGKYELKGTGIFDAAAQFKPGMFDSDSLIQTLSFQIKKVLPIGRGGAILTNSKEVYDWIKLSSYDGRDLTSRYDSPGHIKSLGWHYYMTPEDAARGILLMDDLSEDRRFELGWANYPDLREYEFFKKNSTGSENR